MVLEIELQHAREYTHLRADTNSRLFAAVRQRTTIGPSATMKDRKSWAVMCRGKKRFVEELPHREPGPNPTCKELLFERSIAKECEPCAEELEQSRIEETHAQQSKFPTYPVQCAKEEILVGDRKWNVIPACRSFDGDSLSAEISKLVMRLVRHYD